MAFSEPIDSVTVVPTTESVEPTPIGLGKPLSIRILSMYPGREDQKQLLVTSAVKSRLTFEASPRAMHYVFKGVEGRHLLQPSSDEPGSRVVYYSPSVLDDAL